MKKVHPSTSTLILINRASQKSFCLIVLTLIFLCSPTTTYGQNQNFLSDLSSSITSLPELPSVNERTKSLGYAGMIGGLHNGVIIAAGGANFPDKLPWEGGKKVWSDAIFLLENGVWRQSNLKLPTTLAYSANVQTPYGIISIGGNNEEKTVDSVFLLKYNDDIKDVEITSYPQLPQPLANMSACFVDNVIYVAGGNDGERSFNSLYKLDLGKIDKWEKLNDFPGGPRSFHNVVAQNTPHSKKIFVIGGRNQTKGQESHIHNTYITYDLKSGEWDKQNTIIVNGEARKIMGASATAEGSMGILVYGGDDGKVFLELEKLESEINSGQNDSIAQKRIIKKNKILNNHSGFSNEILAFNTITEKWFVYGTSKTSLPVTSLSFSDKDSFYIISGETSPGIRTAESSKITLLTDNHSFGFWNYVVLIAYLLITILIGLYFANKQRSTADYFSGGGRVPSWAAGISLFGTLLSALTFMAIPAKSFLTDWSYFFLNITAVLIVPVIVFIFIPYFNKLNITTAYEFLENRFNYLARVLGSLSFILFQLGRIGIVLLLPSLAIAIVTGISVEASILIMGILCILYTTFGGIEAVIWTDVLQVIVLMGGSILAIFYLLAQLDMDMGEVYDFAYNHNKFNIMNFDFKFTESTFWVVFLGGLASALITQSTDQTVVQRYLTSSSVKGAQKVSYVNAILSLPATFIFFGIGTLLFVFYSKMPAKLPMELSNNDSIFPLYIVNELPIGISGLLIAAVFSAAMSSISSSLNSVSTAFCNDFYKHFKPNTPDLKLLKIARITTLVIGFLGIILALWMAKSEIKSLWDQFLLFIGLLTAGLGGMFLLGVLTKKANAKGTLLGVLTSTLLLYYLSTATDIHILMYSFIGLVTCYLSGYIFSLIFTDKKRHTN
ncbi:sodium:solute symporter family transporter [Kriegella aquimaris]|uniref:Cyclically-permuted mutarotase family protein n=1 Tax=Kriegella aquimaris TaxID=192904 RepID=A0A1G9VE31_9FLAO|nr:sodium/solute symporter [Kriegella aquimaris]SDM70125.1 cyclically-permuted mutarotase family protein [Kriegella aquimaris]